MGSVRRVQRAVDSMVDSAVWSGVEWSGVEWTQWTERSNTTQAQSQQSNHQIASGQRLWRRRTLHAQTAHQTRPDQTRQDTAHTMQPRCMPPSTSSLRERHMHRSPAALPTAASVVAAPHVPLHAARTLLSSVIRLWLAEFTPRLSVHHTSPSADSQRCAVYSTGCLVCTASPLLCTPPVTLCMSRPLPPV